MDTWDVIYYAVVVVNLPGGILKIYLILGANADCWAGLPGVGTSHTRSVSPVYMRPERSRTEMKIEIFNTFT